MEIFYKIRQISIFNVKSLLTLSSFTTISSSHSHTLEKERKKKETKPSIEHTKKKNQQNNQKPKNNAP